MKTFEANVYFYAVPVKDQDGGYIITSSEHNFLTHGVLLGSKTVEFEYDEELVIPALMENLDNKIEEEKKESVRSIMELEEKKAALLCLNKKE